MSRGRALALLLPAALLLAAAQPVAGDAEDDAPLFEPRPLSRALYDVQPPSADPAVQRRLVNASDGAPIYVETYLPAAKPGGVAPPARVPTILMMTPYDGRDSFSSVMRHADTAERFVPYGYAVAIGHLPGTGRSGGCLDLNGPTQVDATARVIEHLGRDAPWSNGRVGMYGVSYDAITQIAVASLGDPSRISYLKAIVPLAGFAGQYDALAHDGVQYAGAHGLYEALLYHGFDATLPPQEPARDPLEGVRADRRDCVGSYAAARADLDLTGARTTYWHDRDARSGVDRVRAATLLVTGLTDATVPPISVPGWFDALPPSTPKKAVVGQWGHAWPDDIDAAGPAGRADWNDMARAWFDRYLLGLPTAVESWPPVQVQDPAGRWRAVHSWPHTGGPPAQLALSDDGTLGAASPDGTTAIRAWSYDAGPGGARFVTPPLGAPLHVTGMPVLDAWLVAEDAQARVAATLRALDADGKEVSPPAHAMRSLAYVAPMPHGYFDAIAPSAVPEGVPVRVPLRFEPTDLVVPAGGRLELRIGGIHSGYCGTAQDGYYCNIPAASDSVVTLLHGCDRASVLRFELPEESPRTFVVRHLDGSVSQPAPEGRMDGGGLASAAVCGREAVAPGDVVRG